MAGPYMIFADAWDSILAILFLVGSFVVWLINQLNKASEERQQAGETLSDWKPEDEQQDERLLVEEEDEWKQPTTVSLHVREHVDTHEFQDRASGFGQLRRLDSTVDDHVGEAFGHKLGTLAAEIGELATASPGVHAAAVAGIAAVFTDPDQLRRAIVLQEILQRPQWD